MVSRAVTPELSGALLHSMDGSTVIGRLYDAYGAPALALAVRMLGDHMAAEEVVQDVFLSAWRSAASFDPSRGTPRAWLLASVHHRCIDRLRGRGGRSRRHVSLDILNEGVAGSDTFDQVAQRLQTAAIRQALAALPIEQRQAIELAYFEGLTQVAIAERLTIPLGTVKGRLRLALEKLRELHARQEADP